MKKTYLYILLLVSVIASCRKDDNRIFSETADQRLNKVLAEYQKELTAAPNGWNAIITPGNQTAYQFYFKFNDSNRVVMYSDFDTSTAAAPRESSYRLKALQQPSLIFDTYSYIHLLSDPDASVNGGSYGAGLSSDFEFAFDSIAGDTIKLIGRVNGTRVNLVRATKQEADLWVNQGYGRALRSMESLNQIHNYFKRITISGIQYEIIINEAARSVLITWIDAGGVTRSFTTGYSYSATNEGITFTKPLNTGNGTISGLYGLVFNALSNSISLTVGNNVSASVIGAIKPVSTDLTAPSRFWNQSVSGGAYWISANGFTINGVVDSLGLRNIPGYEYLIFWARFNVSGGVNYDLLGYVTNNSLGFGLAFRPPTFTADGRIVLTLLGTLGAVPPSATTIVSRMAAMMTDPAGFYLVQTGPNTYDMVNAKDAKSWMSFEWIW